MKKLIYKFSVLLMVGIIIFGCQKERLESQTNLSTKKIEYRLDNIPVIKNQQDVQILLTNPENEDDEKINFLLYDLSLAVRELIENKEFNEVIIELAQKSPTQSANLLDLKRVAPNFYRKINQNLEEIGNNTSRKNGGNYTIESIAKKIDL